jgi:hypothetical protein
MSISCPHRPNHRARREHDERNDGIDIEDDDLVEPDPEAVGRERRELAKPPSRRAQHAVAQRANKLQQAQQARPHGIGSRRTYM